MPSEDYMDLDERDERDDERPDSEPDAGRAGSCHGYPPSFATGVQRSARVGGACRNLQLA